MDKCMTQQSKEIREQQHEIKDKWRKEDIEIRTWTHGTYARHRWTSWSRTCTPLHRERKALEQRTNELEMQQNVLKAEHKRMLGEIKAAKDKEIRFRKQYVTFFWQSRKLQDRTMELKEECEEYSNRTDLKPAIVAVKKSGYNEEAAASSSVAAASVFSSAPPHVTTPVVQASSGSAVADEMTKLRQQLQDALARKDMYKGYWEQTEQYANDEAEETQRLKDECAEKKAESSTTPSHKSNSKLKEFERITCLNGPQSLAYKFGSRDCSQQFSSPVVTTINMLGELG